MPETALATVPPLVTSEDLELIKRTVANGATDAELKLFLFDCKRRGVHPLDKLIYFTKRDGKYTPVTSIDFMRSQAAMTGEMAGSDEPRFDYLGDLLDAPATATVTVHRLTQGQRFAYTATARWDEYCPEAGASGKGDRMWRKMPHTMLGKCAEALALRKAFPQQLAGLYAQEELDQAEVREVKMNPELAADARVAVGMQATPPEDARDNPDQTIVIDPARVKHLPPGVVFVSNVVPTRTRNKNVTKYTLTLIGGPDWPANLTTVSTIRDGFADIAETAWKTERPVRLTTRRTDYGYDVETIELAVEPPQTRGPEVTAAEIPFR